MERVPVDSSTLVSVGYEPSTKILEVEFRSGCYQYFGVPAHIHEGLMCASSKGSFLDRNVKKAGYSYSKIW